MKNYKKTIKTLRFLSLLLTAVLLMGVVSAFAGAKATLQGGALVFEDLIETKPEKIIRTKVTGNKAKDISLDINVEYITAGSDITIEADAEFDGAIVATITKHTLNAEKTRIAQSNVELTVSGEDVYVGEKTVDGIFGGQSANVSFDNETYPGARLGDSDVLYEMQLLFKPKTDHPFFYTYFIHLDSSAPIPVQPKEETPEVASEETTPDKNISRPITPDEKNEPEPAKSINVSSTETIDTSKVDNASPYAAKMIVDGKEYTCAVYTINEYNYFKLRDLAMAFNNTQKSFSVNWDNAKDAISINSHAPYSPVGGELIIPSGFTAKGNVFAKPISSTVVFDNKVVNLVGYNMGQNTYFKLRDIARLVDANVNYDQATNTMIIDTQRLY